MEVGYQLEAGDDRRQFHVDRTSGELTLAKALDFEETSLYTVDIVAKDCGHYELSQMTTVVIVVVDVNDNAPSITLHPHRQPHRVLNSSSSLSDNPHHFEVQVSELATPGTLVVHMSASDRDSGENGRLSCFVGGLDVGGLFALHRFQHGHYAVMVSGARRLDHERRRSYQLTVTCADHGQPSFVSTLDMVISVTDENDNSPQFAVDPVVASLVENNRIGALVAMVSAVVIALVSAVDRDIGSNGLVRYSLQPAGVSRWLSVDQLTGRVTAQVSLDRELMSSVE